MKKKNMILILIAILLLFVLGFNIKYFIESTKDKMLINTCYLDTTVDDTTDIKITLTINSKTDGTLSSVSKLTTNKYVDSEIFELYKEYLKTQDKEYTLNEETFEVKWMEEVELEEVETWYKDYINNLEKNGYTCE